MLPEQIVVDVAGTPTLLMHGDELCTADVAYQRFRARIAHPVARRRGFFALPYALRRGIAGLAAAQEPRRQRAASRKAILDVDAGAVDDSVSQGERRADRSMATRIVRRGIALVVDGRACERYRARRLVRPRPLISRHPPRGFTYARSRVEKPRAKRHAGGLAHAPALTIRLEPMTPDVFSTAWLSALATIIVIDLVLAGDNAIVIGLAARNVPERDAEARGALGHGRRDHRSRAADDRRRLAAQDPGVPADRRRGARLHRLEAHAGRRRQQACRSRRNRRCAARSRRSSSRTPSWASTTCSPSAAPRRARCCSS